jgi:hypothetical protein
MQSLKISSQGGATENLLCINALHELWVLKSTHLVNGSILILLTVSKNLIGEVLQLWVKTKMGGTITMPPDI